MAHKYTIYTEKGALICQTFSDDPPTSPVWRVILAQGDLKKLENVDDVKIGMESEKDLIEGKVLSREGNIVTIKGVKVRENLRIPVKFTTYVYPIEKEWEGRAEINSNDLSCGGFAFFCSRSFEEDDVVEVVLPITSRPLILKLKVLRTKILPDGRKLYAAEFHDMLHEEEMMVRETVFKLQLKYVPE